MNQLVPHTNAAMAKPASDQGPLATDISTRSIPDGSIHENSPQGLAISRSPLATTGPADLRSTKETAQYIGNSRQSQKNNSKVSNLAHQAALRRAHTRGTSVSQRDSANISEPVLVHPAPHKTFNMKIPRSSSSLDSPSPILPAPANFSFDEILASIGSEAHDSIDAIAEICGRSKLSLADEHASHRPPQGEVEALPIARTEFLTGTGAGRDGAHGRSTAIKLTMSRSGDANGSGEAVAANATAAMSNVTSHVHMPKHGRRNSRTENHAAALVPQIMAWLRGSENADVAGVDVGAANSLHRLLDEADGART